MAQVSLTTNSVTPSPFRPLRIASLNVREMKEFAKREQLIQDIITRNIDIMCIQETKLSNSTVEKRKGHTFVFSSNSNNNRGHHGVGICYNNKMEDIQKQLQTNRQPYYYN